MLDKNGYTGAVLTDLSKAFDTINLDLLIAKLNVQGFTKNSSRLIKSYLSNRWQKQKSTQALAVDVITFRTTTGVCTWAIAL